MEFEPIRSPGNPHDDLIHTRSLSNNSGTVTVAESHEEHQYDPDAIEAAEMDEGEARHLRRIATNLSRKTSHGSIPGRGSLALDFDANDPTLQPQNKEFNPHKWVKSFIHQFEVEGLKTCRTGVMFKDLNVSGTAAAVQLQQTVSDFIMAPLRPGEFLSLGKKAPKKILHSFDGLMKSGEMLIVLGRPGSGCSTLLKTMCGELHGLSVDPQSVIHYNGIEQKQMKREFRGEVIYNQEVDKHFPHLTVGQTLEFAAAVRCPSSRIMGMTRDEFSHTVTEITMAVTGLSHTYNTKVGDDFVRGVSGGERKRVSIAEMMLAGSPLAAWDNSTRGLDSATALKFVQTLRRGSDLGGSANAVAIYQASQAIYDLFDKATVLYEGRQIYFGPAGHAKTFFERQGWLCPQRQTTGDFLTSITNPLERKAREGMERQVPRTPADFEQYWRSSPEYQALREDMESYTQEFTESSQIDDLREHKKQRQAKNMRPKSPYIISVPMQIKLNTKRAYQRIMGDISATASGAIMNLITALIMGSIFYNTPDATAGFYSKGGALFVAVLTAALSTIAEISSLYSQRPIIEKHVSYAFYHPSTEAIAGIVCDVPIKFIQAVSFNIVLYFLAGLRREPGQFFLFFLISFICTLTMTGIFRTMASLTKTVSQAMSLAGVSVLILVIYTGYVVAVPQMHPWFGWLRFLNPLFYSFEFMIANEFHGREFICSAIMPPYSPLQGESWICNTVGAVAGRATVSGDAFIAANYQYYWSHAWRNFGIIIAFLVVFMITYVCATEFSGATKSSAEVLVFRRGKVPAFMLDNKAAAEAQPDEESGSGSSKGESSAGGNGDVNVLQPQTDVFVWKDVVYDIEIKKEGRRLLDHVSGWVKPGTLTALMGVSGAGKTTLLDVLAQRTTMGVITGDMLVNGNPLDESFQRKTGYVQQQDLHLETATVRESLRFSAMLRQPKSVSKAEKYKFVEDVIAMLNMADFADAVVGIPGQGLNVEQRKLLTIGVELAAKPKLLLFLDEPTSGLDSQSSWAIVAFLRKLADAGQAVLCTVHQPSAILFQEFDRLLFLAKGGKTVYFGDIGQNSQQLLDYFEAEGARPCGAEENPAEYMLEIVNNGSNGQGQDWHTVWLASRERQAVEAEINRLIHDEKRPISPSDSAESQSEFAMPFSQQLISVTNRVFQQYWRMPEYIFAKFALGACAGLFIGFSFYDSGTSLAGMQNSLFAVFQIITVFSSIVQQIQPLFVTQRSLYEVRERPSKAYSWQAFLIGNIVVEVPYMIITGILVWACFYFPVVGAGQSSERQGLVLLLCIQMFVYASAYAHMTIAALPDATTAGGVVTLLMMMSLVFSGVIQTPDALPGFWTFMYYLSPFTYWISGMVSTMLHDRPVVCSATEMATFNPPLGQTCGQYLADFLATPTGEVGSLQNPNDTDACRFCSISVADQYLVGNRIEWGDRWRNSGILWAYIFFNIFVAVLTYYIFRVEKKSAKSKAKKQSKAAEGTAAAAV